MSEKFVLRLLDANRELLAWAEENLVLNGARYHTDTTRFHVYTKGVPDKISIEWCDQNLVRETDTVIATMKKVSPGDVLDFHWKLDVIWDTSHHVGTPRSQVILPPVTVRQSIAIGVPSVGSQ